MLRTTAAGSDFKRALITSASFTLRARKCCAGIGVKFSAAYRSCIGCFGLVLKSITIWLSNRFHSATWPNPQLLCRQNEPGRNCSSCFAAFEVSFPDSTSFSNSESIGLFILRKRFPRARENWRRAWCFALRLLTQSETVAAVPPSICSSMTFPIGIFHGLAIDMACLKRRHRRFDARRGTRQSAFELLSPVCSNNHANQRELQAASKIEC